MSRFPLVAALVSALLLSSLAAPARGELLRGPYEYSSPVAFEGALGLQGSLGGFTPGGFDLLLGYTHRFARAQGGNIGVWFFADLNIAAGPGVGVCKTIQGDY